MSKNRKTKAQKQRSQERKNKNPNINTQAKNYQSEEDKILSLIESTYEIKPLRIKPSDARVGDLKSISDLWFAHIGGSLPEKNTNGEYILKTAYSYGRKSRDMIPINGKLVEFNFTDPRNTKHFTISCAVRPHNDRNEEIYEDSRRYGIVISDAKTFIERNCVIDTKSEDLVVLGNVKLKDFVLFVPFNEKDKFKNMYPDIHIESHMGNIEECMEQYVYKELNRPVMKFSANGWVNERQKKDIVNEEALKRIIYDNGLPYLEPYLFQGTEYEGLELSRRMALMIIEFIEVLKQKNIDYPIEKIHENIDLIIAGRLSNIGLGQAMPYSANLTWRMFLRGIYEIFKDKGIEIPDGLSHKVAISSGITYKRLEYNNWSSSFINPNTSDIATKALISTLKEELQGNKKNKYSTTTGNSSILIEFPFYVQPTFMYEGMSFLIEKLLDRSNSDKKTNRPGVEEMLKAGFIDFVPLNKGENADANKELKI